MSQKADHKADHKRESKIEALKIQIFEAIDDTQMIDNSYKDALVERQNLKSEITKILQVFEH